MSWSPQQDAALLEVRDWLCDPRGSQIFRLFGFGGTGKSTLAREMATFAKGRVLYATFTGKAALVMRAKGCVVASTIHSLIYKATSDEVTGKVTFKLNANSDLASAALLIIDEVSMVSDELAQDLLSFGVRVLVLGDPAQLPPVKGEGFFIMAEPDVMLTEVHRQAKDNPLIRMSMDVREGRQLAVGRYGDSAVVRADKVGRDALQAMVLTADQVICGLNRTRMRFNGRIRSLKGLTGRAEFWHPVQGDRVICLRNNRERQFLNGSLWSVGEANFRAGKMRMVIDPLDEERPFENVSVYQEFFNGTDGELDWKVKRKSYEFTYGWTITCHKSQGSQWREILVFDESQAFRESRANWLYTAITRASERAVIVV